MPSTDLEIIVIAHLLPLLKQRIHQLQSNQLQIGQNLREGAERLRGNQLSTLPADICRLHNLAILYAAKIV